MGQVNNEMNHYLSDEKRFADLFNGVHFRGRPVIQAPGGRHRKGNVRDAECTEDMGGQEKLYEQE